MYCIKCGVRLAESEKKCPLCGTLVFHPDMTVNREEKLYPERSLPKGSARSHIKAIAATFAFLLPIFTVLLCDFQISGGISWSGYVIGGILTLYVMAVLPSWFASPNPVIFVPCSFVAIGCYLLYIDLAVGGKWFLSLAFPAVGGIAIIVTTVTVLLKYVKKGLFYILGGAFMALGGYIVLIEFLISVTFETPKFIGWSFYPLIIFLLLGGFLIYLAVSRSAREALERRFFF